MSKKDKNKLWIMGCTLFVVWTVLAVFIKEDWIPRLNLWTSLIVGTGTTITSIIALVISILSFRKSESLRKEKIEEEANKFISKNSEELLYIPLCVVANAYDNHHKYNRKIYNYFNLLNKDVQREVLKQLNYECDLVKGKHWIEESLNRVRNFIFENDLGKDFLYDGGKYFFAALEFNDHEYDGSCEFGHIMPDIFNWNPKIFFKEDKVYSENVTFFDYVDSYLNAKKNDPIKYNLHKNKRPLDVIAEQYHFSNCSLEELSYWLMLVVADITLMMIRDANKERRESLRLYRGDAELVFFEDRFLDVLMDLYNLDYLLKNKPTSTEDKK